jgi:hypothetical protein
MILGAGRRVRPMVELIDRRIEVDVAPASVDSVEENYAVASESM